MVLFAFEETNASVTPTLMEAKVQKQAREVESLMAKMVESAAAAAAATVVDDMTSDYEKNHLDRI